MSKQKKSNIILKKEKTLDTEINFSYQIDNNMAINLKCSYNRKDNRVYIIFKVNSNGRNFEMEVSEAQFEAIWELIDKFKTAISSKINKELFSGITKIFSRSESEAYEEEEQEELLDEELEEDYF